MKQDWERQKLEELGLNEIQNVRPAQENIKEVDGIQEKQNEELMDEQLGGDEDVRVADGGDYEDLKEGEAYSKHQQQREEAIDTSYGFDSEEKPSTIFK